MAWKELNTQPIYIHTEADINAAKTAQVHQVDDSNNTKMATNGTTIENYVIGTKLQINFERIELNEKGNQVVKAEVKTQRKWSIRTFEARDLTYILSIVKQYNEDFEIRGYRRFKLEASCITQQGIRARILVKCRAIIREVTMHINLWRIF